MSRLSKFLAEPIELELRGQKIKVYPLKVKDLLLFTSENPTREEQAKINKELIKKSLIDEPDITDEEIDNLNVSDFTAIMNAINEANGFTNEQIRSIKERIIQAKTQ